jgi:nitroreductase
MENYLESRRTRRNFSDKEVSTEMLREIVGEAMRAPNTGNMQTYSVVYSRKGEARKALEALHFNQPASTGADLLLTVCADFNHFTRWCRLSDADPGYDNFLSFTSAMTDAVILAQQIVTAAELRGLGTCYLGTVTYNAPEIAALLELPELVVPVACLAIGWPADDGVESERLDVDAILFEDHYPQLSDDEIRKNYEAKDLYGPNEKFIKENGKQTLAQVFAEIRYPRSTNEPISDKLLAYLKTARFLK